MSPPTTPANTPPANASASASATPHAARAHHTRPSPAAATAAGKAAAARGASEQQPQQLREVGALGAWSVTSAKPGNGVELLRDGSTDTYWQSDGAQPHLVNIQFNKRVEVSEVHLYLDYKADESYTPCRLSIRAGCSFNNLKDICIVEMREPTGWVKVPLSSPAAAGSSEEQQQQQASGGERPVRAFLYQVAVLANHQNGRDTHIRQIALFGPTAQQAPMSVAGAGGMSGSTCAGGGGSAIALDSALRDSFASFGIIR